MAGCIMPFMGITLVRFMSRTCVGIRQDIALCDLCVVLFNFIWILNQMGIIIVIDCNQIW